MNVTAYHLKFYISCRKYSVYVYKNQRIKNMLSSEFKSNTNVIADHLKT